MLGIRDKAEALDFDVALAKFAKHETWRHVLEAGDGDEADWFVRMLLLVMEMV